MHTYQYSSDRAMWRLRQLGNVGALSRKGTDSPSSGKFCTLFPIWQQSDQRLRWTNRKRNLSYPRQSKWCIFPFYKVYVTRSSMFVEETLVHGWLRSVTNIRSKVKQVTESDKKRVEVYSPLAIKVYKDKKRHFHRESIKQNHFVQPAYLRVSTLCISCCVALFIQQHIVP